MGSSASYKKPVVPEVPEETHVPSIFPSLKHIENQNAEASNTISKSSNNIYSEHINPKSIIHKFEQLVKNNARQSDNNNDMAVENSGIPKSVSCTTNMSSATDPTRCSGSLTYISSVVSETSPRNFNDDDEEENDDSDIQDIDDSEEEDDEEEEEGDDNVNEETYQGNHTETDELYEELGSGNTMARKEQVNIDFKIKNV